MASSSSSTNPFQDWLSSIQSFFLMKVKNCLNSSCPVSVSAMSSQIQATEQSKSIQILIDQQTGEEYYHIDGILFTKGSKNINSQQHFQEPQEMQQDLNQERERSIESKQNQTLEAKLDDLMQQTEEILSSKANEDTLSELNSIPSIAVTDNSLVEKNIEFEEISSQFVEPTVDIYKFSLETQERADDRQSEETLTVIEAYSEKIAHEKIDVNELPLVKIQSCPETMDLNETMTSCATTVTDTETTNNKAIYKPRKARMSFGAETIASSQKKIAEARLMRRLSSAPTAPTLTSVSSSAYDPESEVFQSLCKERVKIQALKDKVRSEAEEKKKFSQLYERSKDKCNKLMDQFQTMRKDLARAKTEACKFKEENITLKQNSLKLQNENMNLKKEIESLKTSFKPSEISLKESVLTSNNAIDAEIIVSNQNTAI